MYIVYLEAGPQPSHHMEKLSFQTFFSATLMIQY